MDIDKFLDTPSVTTDEIVDYLENHIKRTSFDDFKNEKFALTTSSPAKFGDKVFWHDLAGDESKRNDFHALNLIRDNHRCPSALKIVCYDRVESLVKQHLIDMIFTNETEKDARRIKIVTLILDKYFSALKDRDVVFSYNANQLYEALSIDKTADDFDENCGVEYMINQFFDYASHKITVQLYKYYRWVNSDDDNANDSLKPLDNKKTEEVATNDGGHNNNHSTSYGAPLLDSKFKFNSAEHSVDVFNQYYPGIIFRDGVYVDDIALCLNRHDICGTQLIGKKLKLSVVKTEVVLKYLDAALSKSVDVFFKEALDAEDSELFDFKDTNDELNEHMTHQLRTYTWCLDYAHIGSLMGSRSTFSLAHLFFLITRKSIFLEQWASGNMMSLKHLFEYYLDKLLFNPKISYNFNHTYYDVINMLKRLFIVYLQVEYAVLSDRAFQRLLYDIRYYLTLDQSGANADSTMKNRDFKVLTYDVDRPELSKNKPFDSWVDYQDKTSQFKLYGSFIRIVCPKDLNSKLYKLLVDNVKHEVDADGLNVKYAAEIFKGIEHDVYMSSYVAQQGCDLYHQLRRLVKDGAQPYVNKKRLEQSLIPAPGASKPALDYDNDDFDYTDDRINAFKTLINSHISILTGQAGTGKTTLLHKYVHRFLNCYDGTNGATVCCVAMSGKAVRNLIESFEGTFSTQELSCLHFNTLAAYTNSLADMAWIRQHHREILHCDLLVVDEYSMPDEHCISKLLSFIPPTCQVIFVGDVEQLQAFTGSSFAGELLALQSDMYADETNDSWLGKAELTVQHRAQSTTRITEFVNNLRSDVRKGMTLVDYLHAQNDILKDPNSGMTQHSSNSVSCNSIFQELVHDYVSNYDYSNAGDSVCLTATRKDCDRLNTHIAHDLRKSSKVKLTKNDVILRLPHVDSTDSCIEKESVLMQGDVAMLTDKIDGDCYSLVNNGSLSAQLAHFYEEALYTSTSIKIESIRFANDVKQREAQTSKKVKPVTKYFGRNVYGKSICPYIKITFSILEYPDSQFVVPEDCVEAFLYGVCKDKSKNHKIRLSLGYAMTTHKAQGSTYDHAYVYLNSPVSDSFITSNWLYTSLTRSKLSTDLYVTNRASTWLRDAYDIVTFAYTNMHLVFDLIAAIKADV